MEDDFENDLNATANSQESTVVASRPQHAWNLTWNVVGSLIATVLVAAYHAFLARAPDLSAGLGIIGSIVQTLPLWLTLPTTFLAAMGLWSLIQGIIRWRRPERLTSSELCLETRTPRLEIDPRSTGPIALQLSGARPQIFLTLRVSNFSTYDVRITNLVANIWFSQPTMKLTIDHPVTVAALSSVTLPMDDMVDESTVTYVKEFMNQGFAKTLYIYVTASCDSEAGSFTVDERFERRDPELASIIR